MNLKKVILFTATAVLFSGCSTNELVLPSFSNEGELVNKNEFSESLNINSKEETKLNYIVYSNEELTNTSYIAEMKRVSLMIVDDSKYNKINLDTQDKKIWFRNLTYSLWIRDISKSQFMELGLRKYPSRKHEFNFISSNL